MGDGDGGRGGVIPANVFTTGALQLSLVRGTDIMALGVLITRSTVEESETERGRGKEVAEPGNTTHTHTHTHTHTLPEKCIMSDKQVHPLKFIHLKTTCAQH